MRFRSLNSIKAVQLSPALIRLPDKRVRRVMDEAALRELEASIARNGVIEPLLVCKSPLSVGYTLVSGERRLTAARRLGLKSVPAVIMRGDEERLWRASLLCNMHRRELGCIELGHALDTERLLRGGTHEDAAAALGIEQDTAKGAVRSLALNELEQELCEAAGINDEWIARILAMPKSERGKLFFGLMSEAKSLGERAEALRSRLRLDSSDSPLRTVAVKDVRIFFNTIDRALNVMQSSGVNATSERHDFDGFVEYSIRIPCEDAFMRKSGA